MEKFRTATYEVHNPKIKKSVRFAVLADLHGSIFGEENNTLLKKIQEYAPDAILLAGDMVVRMDPSTLETARKLRQLQCKVPIIFLTASPDYAIESYEVQASGYLLKSFSEEKLMKLLNRILKTDMKRRVAIKNRRQYRYPCTDDIMYIDSNKHNVTLHLSDGSEIITVDKLGEIEKRINEKRFLRCHQSYLVNMDYIKDVEDDFIMEDGTLVPIRVRGRKEILDTYYDYFVNHFGDSKDTFAE